jgi:hypothetical protein
MQRPKILPFALFAATGFAAVVCPATWAQILPVPQTIVSVAILKLIDRQHRIWPAPAPDTHQPPPG